MHMETQPQAVEWYVRCLEHRSTKFFDAKYKAEQEKSKCDVKGHHSVLFSQFRR